MHGGSPAQRRSDAIDRIAGLPPQFEQAGEGWLFRHRGHGPALGVTDAEHAGFMRAGLRAIVLHAIALALFGWLAWLLLERFLPAWSDNGIAFLFGIIMPLIGAALHRSMRHRAEMPARLLAKRRPVMAAREPDDLAQPSYRTIAALTLFLLFMAAIGTRQPPSFYIAFASGSVMLGAILALRRWRFQRRLTAVQAEQLRARAATERQRQRESRAASRSVWKGLLLIAFILLELAMLLGAMVAGVAIVLGISGRSFEQLSFGLFMLGFIPGLALGGLAFVPFDRLCRRWTGSSAMTAFDWIPAGW